MSVRTEYTSDWLVSLAEYTKSDDRALYDNWLDPDVQKGYNFVLTESFEDFSKRELKQRFFAMIQLNGTGEIAGAVGVSPPESPPDLAIWIFAPYRKQGYGVAAFALATKYALEMLNISELYAGAYPDNTGSQRMLEKCGYVRFPQDDLRERHYLTGEEIIQWGYVFKGGAV
jgi:RimJ/RimL family protein N-acetyltransferase